MKRRQVREKWTQHLANKQVRKRGKETGVRTGKRSLLSCHANYKYPIETTRNLVKVNLGIKFMKLVNSLVGWEVTVTGRWSECH